MFARASATGEGDQIHPRIAHQRLGDRFAISDECAEHCRRQPGLVQQFGEADGRQRCLAGRLEQHRHTGRDRRGQLVRHLIERMIERRDRGDQAKRLAHRENLSRRPVLCGVAGEDALVVAQRLGGGELEHLLCPAYFVAGLAHAQAGLESDQVGKLIRALGQKFTCAHEDFVTLVFGRRLSLAKRSHDRLFKLLRRDLRQRTGQRTVPRVTHLERVIALHRFAGDVAWPSEGQLIGDVCRLAHDWVPLQTKSKMSKFRGSPLAKAAYAALSGSEMRNGTISS